MKHYTLREIAKFGAGLVAGDFLTLWWLSGHNVLPINFMGIAFTPEMVAPGLLFDAGLFLTCVHYGWQLGKIPAIRERIYFGIVGTIFTLVALAHLLRLFFSVDFTVADWTVPLWLSWIGIAITTYLAYMSFRLVVRHR